MLVSRAINKSPGYWDINVSGAGQMGQNGAVGRTKAPHVDGAEGATGEKIKTEQWRTAPTQNREKASRYSQQRPAGASLRDHRAEHSELSGRGRKEESIGLRRDGGAVKQPAEHRKREGGSGGGADGKAENHIVDAGHSETRRGRPRYPGHLYTEGVRARFRAAMISPETG